MPGYEHFGKEEIKEVNDVLETGILMRYGFDGPRKGIWKAKELEQAICETFGCKHAQLLSSGTAALTTAMSALGIGYGDEVILPSFTFVASFEAVLSVGAIPVFVDVDDTLTLDPEAVRNALTPKTKCLMPVHMCGSMADLDALQAICKEHNIVLLEDACQSIGGSYKGKKLGTIGDAGTFSFDFVKTITCAEGGVVMSNREDVYIASDGYTDHGHDHTGVDRGADLHPFIGYNFRISELHAAVGEEATKAVVAELKAQNILAGNFYWFVNNWHYISKWDHLKNAVTLNSLHPDLKAAVIHHATKDFAASDAIMSRCISTAIGLMWTDEQLKTKCDQLVGVIQKVLSEQKVAL
ncbi:MAG: DegT/DnrJ/EryC1/StrS family aminotransferase [Chitinophagaceae bacterium]|nr:DegT/DnrJ/EryC1/StrS family aminotransferase [Chitinophagaceae bacterium]